MQRLSVWTCLALALAALAMAAYHAALDASGSALPSLVEFALSAMSVLYGGLLGVFAVGFLWPSRGSDASAVLGLGVGAAIGLALFLQPLLGGEAWLAWGFRIPLAASFTAAIVLAGARPQRG
jgi:hypothetical protein